MEKMKASVETNSTGASTKAFMKASMEVMEASMEVEVTSMEAYGQGEG